MKTIDNTKTKNFKDKFYSLVLLKFLSLKLFCLIEINKIFLVLLNQFNFFLSTTLS